jgi:hypothetical protein
VPLRGDAEANGHAGKAEPQIAVVSGPEEADVVAHDDHYAGAEHGEEEDPYPGIRSLRLRLRRGLAPNPLGATFGHVPIVIVAGLKMGI